MTNVTGRIRKFRLGQIGKTNVIIQPPVFRAARHVTLKAKQEIRQLHEKIDHQMVQQWHKLAVFYTSMASSFTTLKVCAVSNKILTPNGHRNILQALADWTQPV